MDYAGRRLAARRKLEEMKVDLLAIAPGADMLYLLGFHPHADERPCYLLLTADHEGFLVPELNATETAGRIALPLTVYKDEDGPVAGLRDLARSMGFEQARTILVDETMRAGFAILLQEQIATARLGIATPLLSAMRLRKDAEEVAILEANAAMADRAMQAAFGALAAGRTEREVVEVVEAAFRAAGADRMAFAIVGAGPNSAFPHHSSSAAALGHGEPVVIDIGGSAHSYYSDITRMAFIGTPHDEYRRIHTVVEEALTAAFETARPGVPAQRVDEAARGVISRAGLGQYFLHRTGHGLGLEVHEPPYITATSTTILEEGMCFSIEPGIYLPGRFGVRLEEIVVMGPTGARILSGLPRTVLQVA